MVIGPIVLSILSTCFQYLAEKDRVMVFLRNAVITNVKMCCDINVQQGDVSQTDLYLQMVCRHLSEVSDVWLRLRI